MAKVMVFTKAPIVSVLPRAYYGRLSAAQRRPACIVIYYTIHMSIHFAVNERHRHFIDRKERHMSDFLDSIVKRAQAQKKTIVLPEGDDERTWLLLSAP